MEKFELLPQINCNCKGVCIETLLTEKEHEKISSICTDFIANWIEDALNGVESTEGEVLVKMVNSCKNIREVVFVTYTFDEIMDIAKRKVVQLSLSHILNPFKPTKRNLN